MTSHWIRIGKSNIVDLWFALQIKFKKQKKVPGNQMRAQIDRLQIKVMSKVVTYISR